MTDQPSVQNEPKPPSADQSLVRGSLVHIVIALTGIMFAAILALLFWRSATVRPPQSSVEIFASDALTGATAVCEGVGLPEAMKLTIDKDHRTRFFLQPGYYTIIIRFDQDRKSAAEFYRQNLLIPAGAPRRYEINLLNATTKPAS